MDIIYGGIYGSEGTSTIPGSVNVITRKYASNLRYNQPLMDLGSSPLLPVSTRHFRVMTWGRTIPFHCPIQNKTAIPELSLQDRTSLLRPVEPSSRIELPLRAKLDFVIIGENACYRIIGEGISHFLLFLPFFPTPSFSVSGELHKPAPHFGAD